MPPSILSSTLVTIPVLNTMLSSPAAHPSVNPTYRLQLLTTKLAILTNLSSQPNRIGFEAELEIIQCRLELARAAMHEDLKGKNLTSAEGELSVVERQCKGLTKRLCREARVRSDRAEEKKASNANATDGLLAPGENRGTLITVGSSSGSTSSSSSGEGGAGAIAKEGSKNSKSSASTAGLPGPASSAHASPYPSYATTELNDNHRVSSSTETTPTQSSLSHPVFKDNDYDNLSLHSLQLTPEDLNGPNEQSFSYFPQSANGPASSTQAAALVGGRSREHGKDKEDKYDTRRKMVTALRIEALGLMGEVEEMLGRPERRGRWDSLALKLGTESGGGASTGTNSVRASTSTGVSAS